MKMDARLGLSVVSASRAVGMGAGLTARHWTVMESSKSTTG